MSSTPSDDATPEFMLQGDLEEAPLPAPAEGRGLEVMIAALTTKCLVPSAPDQPDNLGDRALAHVRQGGRLRLLLTSRLTQVWWQKHQPGISRYADQRDAHVEGFLDAAGDHATRVEVREHLWLPSMGLTAWGGDEGHVWLVPYTLDPETSGKEKVRLKVRGDSEAGGLYREQFERLWSRAHQYASRPDNQSVRALEAQADALMTRATRAAGRHADLAVVIALSEELTIFRARCEARWTAAREVWCAERPDKTAPPETMPWEAIGSGGFFDVAIPPFDAEGNPKRLIVGLIGEMGKAPARAVAAELLGRFHPDAIVSIGIAGLISDDLELGDVIVPSTVHDYMHRSKARDRPAPEPPSGKKGKGSKKGKPPEDARSTEADADFALSLGGSTWRTDRNLTRAARELPFSRRAAFEGWAEASRERTAEVLEVRATTDRALMYADDAHLASGDVVAASTAFHRFLKGADRNLMAVEMEAVGVVAAATERPRPVPCMVIRGISDRADKTKGKLEIGSGETRQVERGEVRKAAMVNAVELLLMLVAEGLVPGDRRSRWSDGLGG